MKTCIVMMVTENYQKYIPLFLYYALTAYPDYSVRIFLSGKKTDQLSKAMKLLSGMGDIEILESTLDKEYGKGVPHEFKCLRWLYYHKEYEKFDNLYFGDIDISIVREPVALADQHLNHCGELSYSNCVRPNSTRLSGLHFVKRQMYYDEMMPTIEKYRAKLKKGHLSTAKNEVVLHDIVKEAGIGFHEGWFRPHHGVHLGLWRKDRILNFSTEKDPGKEYRRLVKEYFAVQTGDMFDGMIKENNIPEFERANKNLRLICP